MELQSLLDGAKVYVANNGHEYVPGKTVSEIDTVTNNVTATVNVGTAPMELQSPPEEHNSDKK